MTIKIAALEVHRPSITYKHAIMGGFGRRNSMVQICRGLSFIQVKCPTGSGRRYGARIVTNSDMGQFLNNRVHEIELRRQAEQYG